MPSSTDDALDAYADSALALHFPALSGEAAARVKAQFARIAQLAAPVLAYGVYADDEPAPVYRP
ncbi:AtzG-like protein [Caballeronia sp. J97]|uniref:AtzG-like protein n=1 Tax=Caballeronia sp. J97 TaxID=2805429 RepID=UPI002AB16141|nr:AtzG-like protein [Caballeronia sp. J97]